jgi:tetratricopeptide (TPR) repeat protein
MMTGGLVQFPPGMIVADLLYNIANFLAEMAKYEGAELIFNKAIEYYQKASQRLNVAKVYTAIARMHNTEVYFLLS